MTNQLLTPLMCFIVAAALCVAGVPPQALPVTKTDRTSAPTRKVEPLADPLVATVAPVSLRRGRSRKRGAIYARFSTKFQASIDDQVRACREWCDPNDVELDDAMIFVDEAT